MKKVIDRESVTNTKVKQKQVYTTTIHTIPIQIY